MKADKAAPEDVQKQIRAMLERQWREAVAVNHFWLKGAVIPGRPALPLKILLWIGVAIFAIPLLIVHTVAELFGIQLSWGPGSDRGQFTVKGPKNCLAAAAGEALLGTSGDLWLAWSHSNIALVADGRILWQASGSERPSLNATKAKLNWPDGSTASFELSEAERTRVRERHGHP
jgi:hypothetical protein